MTLFQQKVVGGGDCIVLISQKTLSSIVSIMAQSNCFLQDVLIDGNGMLAHYDALERRRTVQAVELMRSDFWQSHAFVAGGQQAFEDVSRERRDIVRNFVIESEYLLVEKGSIGVLCEQKVYFEGQSANDHCIKDDSAAPKVHLKSIVSFSCYHFRCSIARTPASSFEFFFLRWFLSFQQCIILDLKWRFFGWQFIVSVGKTEVNYLDVLLAVQKHIFRLEIAMDDAQSMQIVNSIDYLMKEAAGLSLGQSLQSCIVLLLFCDIVKQFSSCAVLHHEEEILGGFYDFVELNQIRMAHQFEYMYLS